MIKIINCVFFLLHFAVIASKEWENEKFCGTTPIGSLPSVTVANNGETIKPMLTPKSRRTKRQARPIINGQLASQSNWPWAVQIHLQKYVDLFFTSIPLVLPNAFMQYCTGSLINKKYVLTAAHCVKYSYADDTPLYKVPNTTNILDRFIRKKEFILYFGRIKPSDKEGVECTIPIKDHTKRHPKFDLALIELTEECTKKLEPLYGDTIRPICLPKSDENYRHENIGRDLVATGWGMTSKSEVNFGSPAKSLMQTILDIKDIDECYKIFFEPVRKNLSPTMARLNATRSTSELMCAARKSTDTCGGDSGGPLIGNFDNKWVQVGAVSIGSSKCASVDGAFYVHLPSAIDWLVKEAQN